MRDEVAEELIDRSLAGYAREPRAGLEQRVLCRVRSADRSRRIAVAALVVSLTAAACALFLMKPAVVEEQVTVARVERPRERLPVAKPMRGPIWGATRVRKPLPRAAVFPAPTPLTEQEKAFLEFTKAYSGVADTLKVELVEIEPLEIRPLRTETGQ